MMQTINKSGRKRISKKAIFDKHECVIKVSSDGKVIVREKIKK